jgi:hypothetical protein
MPMPISTQKRILALEKKLLVWIFACKIVDLGFNAFLKTIKELMI